MSASVRSRGRLTLLSREADGEGSDVEDERAHERARCAARRLCRGLLSATYEPLLAASAREASAAVVADARRAVGARGGAVGIGDVCASLVYLAGAQAEAGSTARTLAAALRAAAPAPSPSSSSLSPNCWCSRSHVSVAQITDSVLPVPVGLSNTPTRRERTAV
jgi:hypothetical protein